MYICCITKRELHIELKDTHYLQLLPTNNTVAKDKCPQGLIELAVDKLNILILANT